MTYFLDSNVIIGYYFACGDSQGRSSIRVFETPEGKYSSNNVWAECWGSGDAGRCRTISYEIAGEFSISIYYLTTGEYSADDLLIAAISEKLRISEIIEYLHERYSNNLKTFINRLRAAQRKYENDCNTRKNELNNSSILTIHHRTNTYPVQEQHFDKHIPDHTDVLILLDAHDLGIIIQDLVFVSGDGSHILANKDSILQLSSFRRIVSVNSI